MTREELIERKNNLQKEINNRRKRYKPTFETIVSFVKKTKEYINFCEDNNIAFCLDHCFGEWTSTITCNEKEFSLYRYWHLLSTNTPNKIMYIHCEKLPSKDFLTRNIFSPFGGPLSLESITMPDGALSMQAEWLATNIPEIESIIEKEIDRQLERQISELENLLSR